MVAGGGQVWILDLKGNLSHFQDGRWQSRGPGALFDAVGASKK